jgi:hypothetical protein
MVLLPLGDFVDKSCRQKRECLISLWWILYHLSEAHNISSMLKNVSHMNKLFSFLLFENCWVLLKSMGPAKSYLDAAEVS